MKKIIAIFAVMVMITACTSPDDATKTLIQAGYTDIHIDGYAIFGCGQDDSFHTKFYAKGPTGQRASGVVCGGFLKGNTIRLD